MKRFKQLKKGVIREHWGQTQQRNQFDDMVEDQGFEEVVIDLDRLLDQEDDDGDSS